MTNPMAAPAGEYIAVEYLESVYAQSDAVEQIWVYGNSYESQLVAVVVPQRHWLKQQAGGGGGGGSKEELAAAAQKDEVRLGVHAWVGGWVGGRVGVGC